MKNLPPPGPGDNFYTICYNCGDISYTNKSSADFCQKDKAGERSTCNPNYHNRDKQPCYNPTVTTCFAEQVNVDEVILRFFKYYEQDWGQWSDPIAAAVLFMLFRYHGPLPQGTEKVIVGGFVIRKVTIPDPDRIGYQFKPFTWLTKDEREVRRNTIVKGMVTTFYKAEETHPLHPSNHTDMECIVFGCDVADYCEKKLAIDYEREQ